MIFQILLAVVSTSLKSSPMRTVLGLGATTLFLVLLFTNGEVRTIGAVLFCLLAPGYGWARRLPGNSRGDTLALAVILSICATILLGTTMAVLHAWAPVTAFMILTAIGIVGFLPLRPSPQAHSQDDWAERRDS